MNATKSMLLIILFAVLMTLTSCSSGAVNSEAADETSINSVQQEQTLTEETTSPEIVPDIPKVDMEGKNFHLFLQDWCNYAPLSITDINVEELNGDVINDASYNRNLEVGQAYNCTISSYIEPSDVNNGYTIVNKSITAGDDEFSFCLMRANQYNKICLSGGFIELGDIPYIDLNKPWWDRDFSEAVAINGKKYGVISDITMNSYLLIGNIYFNKNMISDYSLENPYELVNSGKWTLDKLYEMGKTVKADLDNDGQFTNKDMFGFTYIDDSPEALLCSFGVTFAEIDSDGIPQVTLYSDSNMTKLMYLSKILNDTETSYNCHARSKVANEDEAGMLVRGNTLFCLGGLYYAPEMRQMDQDFGIIPYPKYGEAQKDYNIPVITIALTYASVPVTNSDIENTGIFMEYYAYLGNEYVLPALYDKLLQGKVTRDDESSSMLDLIFNNRIYDTGMIFDFASLRTTVRVMYHNLQDNFASAFAANESKVQANIDEIVEMMK